jgi:hypothetical protein
MNTIVNITGLTLKCLETSDENAIRKAKKKEYDKKYREKNKERIKLVSKIYTQNNRGKVREWSKKYRENNKEKVKLFKKIYTQNNKDKQKKWTEKYLKNNPEKVRLYKLNYKKNNRNKINDYVRNRYQNDKEFKLKMLLRHRIFMALKGKVKSKKTADLLGCTIEQLWVHLEKSFKNGMTRDNHGKWHVDHIIPCSSFDLTNPEEQAKCFHYSNLQALWAKENLSKNNKILSPDATV